MSAMSEKRLYSAHFVSGVIKFDYTVAGFPDILKVAKEWSTDKDFYELLVRSVSDKNFGLQFNYYAEGTEIGWFGDTYVKPLLKKFPAYAVDIAYEGRTREEAKASALAGVVVSKPLPIKKDK